MVWGWFCHAQNRLFLTDIRPRDKIPKGLLTGIAVRKILVFILGLTAIAASAQFEQSFDTHNRQSNGQFEQSFDTHNGQPSVGCQCACVNGRMQSICPNAVGVSQICSGSCPTAPTSIAPSMPGVVSPVGTSRCSPQQVLNPVTGVYQWQNICR